MFKILTMGEHVSVVQPDNESVFMPYILKDQVTYCPRSEFRPFPAKHRQRTLNDVFLPEAKVLLMQAEEIYNASLAATPQVVQVTSIDVDQVQAAAPQPVTQIQQIGLLENLIAQSVAQIVQVALNGILEATKPMIKEFIEKEYGVLPVTREAKPNEPTKVDEITNNEKFDTIFGLMMENVPVLLTGASVNAIELCRQVALETNLDFYYSGAIIQENKITGSVDGNGTYHETKFYKAFTNGGLIMFDHVECGLPDVLILLNDAIANRYFNFPSVGRVEAHDNFRIVVSTATRGYDIKLEGFVHL